MTGEDGKIVLYVAGLVGNLGGIGVAGYFLKRWINRQEADISKLHEAAEVTAARLYDKIDDVLKCMSSIKVNVEKKADKESLTESLRDYEERLLHHKHTCCIEKDAKVFYQT